MEIKFLGGAREVGRSAIFVKSKGGARILLDYGVKIEPSNEVQFPMHVSPKDLDAVVLTHAHLDHSGAIPMLFISSSPKLIATEATYRQSEYLLRDMLKLNGDRLFFGEVEVRKALGRGERVDFNEPVRIKDVEIELIDAGHIPGSAQVVLNSDRTLLYTADFNTVRTRLMEGAEVPSGGFDVVITESTYAREDHAPRKELERALVEELKGTVENGGAALVPAFSVARSQEVAMILKAYSFQHEVYMDGMAKELTTLYLEMEEFVDGIQLLGQAAKRVRFVKGRRMRERILGEPAVVISPAGMLQGGPAVYYARSVADRDDSSITFVSFQVPGTPGEAVLSRRVLEADGEVVSVRSRVTQIRLSAHAGRKELHEYLRKTAEGAKVFAVHGEPESCAELARWAREELGADAVDPELGSVYEV
jgi:putative mRNA 3-end processing factor